MKPIFTTVDTDTHVVVLPDVRYEMDGHPILTYDYHVYKDIFEGSGQHNERPREQALAERMQDPEYMGYITFEHPGKMFEYTPGPKCLGSNEVQELIAVITHYRDGKNLWQV